MINYTCIYSSPSSPPSYNHQPLQSRLHPSVCANSVQFSSVAQSCLTLCDPMNRSTPGLPVHHHLQTHVHRVGDAIQPSHPLSSPFPPAPDLCYLGSLKSENESHSFMSDSLPPHGLYSPWNSPGQNTGVGILQGIFPTQGWKPGLSHYRRILNQPSYGGSLR